MILTKKIFKTKSTSLFNPSIIYYALIKPIGIKRNQFFGPTELGKHKNFVGVRKDVKATPISLKNMIGLKAGIFSIKDVERSLSKNDNLTSVLFSTTPYEVVLHYDRSMMIQSHLQTRSSSL